MLLISGTFCVICARGSVRRKCVASFALPVPEAAKLIDEKNK